MKNQVLLVKDQFMRRTGSQMEHMLLRWRRRQPSGTHDNSILLLRERAPSSVTISNTLPMTDDSERRQVKPFGRWTTLSRLVEDTASSERPQGNKVSNSRLRRSGPESRLIVAQTVEFSHFLS